MQTLDLNEQFQKALNLLESSNNNLFITGRAGTGKSTLLDHFRNNTSKNIAILAPTGVAAINVRGQTIHSFFGFKPDITVDKVRQNYQNKSRGGLFKKLDCLVIDEISMVRADLLDCVDQFLRLNGRDRNAPFGGIRVIFFGDLYQLPPVVGREETEIFSLRYPSPYFFDANVIKSIPMEMIELTKIYRQNETSFIEILNAVRNGQISELELNALNSRHDPDFVPPINLSYIRLTTTNAKADQINQHELDNTKGEEFQFEGTVIGNFDTKSLPSPQALKLKIGSQVMMVNNDKSKRWVNGTMGRIDKISKTENSSLSTIWVKLDSGEVVDVVPNSWDMFRFVYHEDTHKVESETVGSYVQYPLILAWAVTIHKSQGKTYERVIVDFGRGTFAHGQAYVALSRATSLAGTVLTMPLFRHNLILDPRVVDFTRNFKNTYPEQPLSLEI